MCAPRSALSGSPAATLRVVFSVSVLASVTGAITAVVDGLQSCCIIDPRRKSTPTLVSRAAQTELDAKVEAVKVAMRSNTEGGGEGGFGLMGDSDARMDFDDEKMRKGGRAKGKHVMGIAARK